LFTEDADEKWVSLTSKQVSFDVSGKPGTKPGEPPGDKPKDDKGGAPGVPPVITQPESYTSGQIGVDGGTKGQTGVGPGTTGQAGVTGQPGPGTTGQPDTGTTQQPVTDGKGEAGVSGETKTGVSGETKTGTTGKPDGGLKGETGLTSGQSGQVGISTKTPACTYQYSEWGDCVRSTKLQARTVIGKEPAGCQETGKPNLERGCNPPPTEEEKRNSYLNCLCRCYCGWAGHIGVWYDPEGKSKPECESSGPCFGGAGAFGCTRRHSFGAPNDCAKACYEGAYGQGTYDEKKADKIRREENKKFKQPLKLKVNEGKCPITAQLGDIINGGCRRGYSAPQVFLVRQWSGQGQYLHLCQFPAARPSSRIGDRD
jgi:hypothetical protein